MSFLNRIKTKVGGNDGNGDDSNNSNGGNGGAPEGGFSIEPAKARDWFDRAKVVADTGNFEYAINCYLNGLKHDPTSMDAHQALLEAANQYRTNGGKPATRKEISEISAGKRAVDKMAGLELTWVKDWQSYSHALKFAKFAAELGLSEVSYWAAELGALAVLRAKKPTKSALLPFIDLFEEIAAPDKAVEFGQLALRLDPSDSQLDARIRNLSAQAAMNKGRYEEGIGEEGGFRRSIRDADKQSELTEDESLAIGADASSRRLARAKADWEEQRDDQNAIMRYVELLRKESTNEGDKEAIRVLLDGFRKTGQYRFRMQAGDIKLSMLRRDLRARRDKAEEARDEAGLQRVREKEQEMLVKEIEEYQERVEKYPTNLQMKYDLGRRLFDNEQYEEAIPVLQEALADSRHKAQTAHYIGLCFLRQEWLDEAIESLRDAADSYELKDDDTHLAMRYDLMVALAEHAKDQGAADAADEAFSIARGIAMKKLNFRDIKDWRDRLRELVKELKQGA